MAVLFKSSSTNAGDIFSFVVATKITPASYLTTEHVINKKKTCQYSYPIPLQHKVNPSDLRVDVGHSIDHKHGWSFVILLPKSQFSVENIRASLRSLESSMTLSWPETTQEAKGTMGHICCYREECILEKHSLNSLSL